ncbi:MAG TPA: GNAT family protein [Ilumatobacter sp.]|nr:GNAT family protein [Ilumatobacter sp.]
MPTITFTELGPDADPDALVEFLVANEFPFHTAQRLTEAEARERVLDGRYWSDESIGFWVGADGERVGIAVIEDVDDIDDGGNPVFDLRLAEAHRRRGLGAPVLRALTDFVFTRWPVVTRFEGHTREDNLAMRATFRRAGWVKEAFYRDAWPVEGEPPVASVAYGMLRRDWEAGTSTPVVWDDL